MRQTLKVSLSLLITLIVFAVFLVVAYTGFFSFIQTGFFRPRVQEEYSKQLKAISKGIEDYHKRNIERFSPVAGQDFVSRAFLTQQSEEDIFRRENFFGKLLENFPNLQFVRFIGKEGKKIHFSTLNSDIRKQDKYRKVYYNLNDTGSSISGLKLVTKPEEKYKVIIDGKNQRFIYSLPVVDKYNVYRGSILFYVSRVDLDDYLINFPGLSFRGAALIDNTGIVVNFPGGEAANIRNAFASFWKSSNFNISMIVPFSLKSKDGKSVKYLLFTEQTDLFGKIGLLVPVDRFEIQFWMKIILSGSLFMTLFLFIYLIFNLRQDPMVILSERIKRFQIEFLQEFIENKEKLNWQKWHRELTLKRNDVKGRIKQGIGRISGNKIKEVDDIIDRSWDEIISIIGRKVEKVPKEESADLKRIEEMIQRALSNGRFIVPAAQETVKPRALPERQRQAVQVEEIDEREVEEVEELSEVEEAGEAVQVEEVEEAEGVEELEELEEVSEIEEPEEAGEAEEVEPAEEVEEVEELSEVEEAGEAVQVEGVEELEELEEVSEIEEPEEIGEAEPAEEPEEVEELNEVEEVEEDVQVEEVEEPEEVEPAEEVEELESIEEKGEDNELEELEVIPGITELPPEPEEELPILEGQTTDESPEKIEEKVIKEGYTAMQDRNQEYTEPNEGIPGKNVEEPASAEEEIEELESIDETELDELNEAEDLGELTEDVKTWSSEEESADLDELLKDGKIHTYTIEEIKELVEKYKHAIVVENGVFRIKEELFDSEQAKVKNTGKGDSDKKKSADKAESDFISIGDLFGDKETEDLFKDVDGYGEHNKQDLTRRQNRVKILPLIDNGIDWDEYLKFYDHPFSDITQVKALVEVSRSVQAVGCAIMIKKDEYFVPDITIGLSAKSQQMFKISENDPFAEHFIKDRLTVICNEYLKDIKYFSEKFSNEDRPYFKRAVFFPAVYKAGDALLFFAFSRDDELGIKELINRFNIV